MATATKESKMATQTFTADLYEAGRDGTCWMILDGAREIVQDGIESDNDCDAILADYNKTGCRPENYPSRVYGLDHAH